MNEMETTNALTFEDFKNQNGMTYWWASEFMLMLGYDDMQTFKNVMNRAIKAFISLGIDHYDNIVRVERTNKQGATTDDYKLSRFACYLIAMNGDPKKKTGGTRTSLLRHTDTTVRAGGTATRRD